MNSGYKVLINPKGGSLNLKRSLEKAKKFLADHQLDGVYISSFDENLSEYVPKEDCHRYFVTGFTGSVAEVLIYQAGEQCLSRLYVDGRYHLQADQETDPEFVEVVKCPYGVSIQEALLDDIKKLNLKTIGVEGNRCSLTFENQIQEVAHLKSFDEDQMNVFIEAPGFKPEKKVYSLPVTVAGEETKDKLSRILKEGEAIFLQELDSIAWITNGRGFHHPFNSTFIAKAICTCEKVYLFLLEPKLTSDEFQKREDLSIHSYQDWEIVTGKIKENVDLVFYDQKRISASHFRKLTKTFGEEKCREKENGIIPYHALKNKTELKEFEESFAKAAKAIHQTICEMKEAFQSEASPKPSEKCFFDKTNENYRQGGALGQSFNTIAAYGPSSAIVHFGHPSEKTQLKDSEFVLLDSGAHYENGLATDCTRTFVPKGPVTEKNKEIYTLVLKSLLSIQAATFKPGTLGSQLDKIARKPLVDKGHNYAHGTGHGVGINVHEPCYSITPDSQVPLQEGLVGSLEPGIYLENYGGVRLENIVTVEKHPMLPGMLRFRPLIYLGFMPELIDENLLNPEEKIWLDQYEEECSKRGCSFRP